MPRVRATLKITLDGEPVRRFPIVRALDADVVADFDIQKNIDELSLGAPTFEELIEDKRVDHVHALLLQPDSTMTVRLGGQSDAGIVLGPGSLMLLFNVKICPALVLVSDANATNGRVRGLIAGMQATPPVVACPVWSREGYVITFEEPLPTGLPESVTILNYHWDFGDGTSADTGTVASVVHAYADAGTYHVTVTVQTSDGCFTSSAGCPVDIPALIIECPDTEITNLSVDFTAIPPVGTIVNYHWNFGDGAQLDTGTTPTANHVYAAAGEYEVVVTVTTTTQFGNSGPCPVTVAAPVVVCPDAEVTDLHVDFAATAPVGTTVTNYHWDFGDGDTLDSATDATVDHDYTVQGTYDVVLTVTTTTGVGVSPACPVEVVAPAFDVECPEAVADGLGVDFTEPPPSLPGGVTVTNYHWDFGDGNEEDTGATNTVHHDYATDGSYAVVVTATASNGGVSSSSAGCPLVEVQACPSLSVAVDFVVDSESLSASGSFTRVGNVALAVRTPTDSGTDQIDISLPLNTMDIGDCTRFHAKVEVTVTVASGGGIPEAYTTGNFSSLVHQIGTGTIGPLIFEQTITGPFLVPFTQILYMNGTMNGSVRLNFLILELLP